MHFKSFIMGILLLSALCAKVKAQQVDEVVMTFAYPAVGQVYLTTVFRGEQPLIGATELLSYLFIPFDRTDNRLGLRGAYPSPKDRWEIDPVNFIVMTKSQRRKLDASDFFVGETDLFLSPAILKEVFDLDVTVNLFALSVSLVSTKALPVEERRKRELIRAQLKTQAPADLLASYPMLYPRNRKLLALGMLDYNIGIGGGVGFSQMNYATNLGLEVLGGDFQMNVAGFRSAVSQVNRFSGVRWRYVSNKGIDPIGNSMFSELTAGQLLMAGPQAVGFRGISLTNNPVVPRRVLDLFAIEGFTTPDSEVELLIAGQLVDFVRADDMGYYRFTTPLSFGTVRIGLRIYTPQGEVITEERQLQIPFTFLPRGIATYNVQAGFQEFAFADSVGTNLIGQGNVTYGLTNSITIRAGATRGLDSTGVGITPFASISARVFDQYLLNADYQPDALARLNASVFYANNTSLNFQYTEFLGQSALNFTNVTRELDVNYFIPFMLAKRASGLRFGLERDWFSNGEELRYQMDVNTRIGPLVSRLNYREEISRRGDFQTPNQRLLTASFTYTIPRTPGIPVFVQGIFFRAQLRHNMQRFDANAIGSFQFSQTIFKTGRLTFNYDRDVFAQVNQFQIGFLMDFNAFRSSTQSIIRSKGRQVDPFYTQNFSGSFAADFKNGVIYPTNRDQVSRAGATIRLFIDENMNGVFDENEVTIPSRAVKLDQSANITIHKDGMLRLSQLQSYWTYRLTVDVAQLPDATLAPAQGTFSFVADPNRYKQIDIPLYKTGTIEGIAYNQKGIDLLEPQPGLRLFLKREGDDKPQVLRTFSDGTFFHYGLIPGNYTLMVDSGQLAFMQVAQFPDTVKFTIRPTAEGDWIDTLQIILRPRQPDSLKKDEPLTLAQLERMLGQKLRTAVKAFSESQELFYRGKFDQARMMADSSLREFPSDFAIAMKGSIAFMEGDKVAATRLWADARERNPFVPIPDTSRIRLKVKAVLPDSLVSIPKATSPADTIAPLDSALLAELEAGLGEQLRKSVSFFVESQENFYRLKFDDALSSIDSSLSYYVSDHALALKGSIVYILGRKNEAWQYWYEAKARNPIITMPDIEVLDRLTTPIAEAPERNARKKLISNR